MKIKVGDDTYEMDWSTLLIVEAKFVKKKTGMTVPEFTAGFDAVDPDALQAAVYIAKKRAGITVQYEDLENLDIANIKIITDDDEDEEEDEESPTTVDAEDSGTSTSTPSGTSTSSPSPTSGDGQPTLSTD